MALLLAQSSWNAMRLSCWDCWRHPNSATVWKPSQPSYVRYKSVEKYEMRNRNQATTTFNTSRTAMPGDQTSFRDAAPAILTRLANHFAYSEAWKPTRLQTVRE